MLFISKSIIILLLLGIVYSDTDIGTGANKFTLVQNSSGPSLKTNDYVWGCLVNLDLLNKCKTLYTLEKALTEMQLNKFTLNGNCCLTDNIKSCLKKVSDNSNGILTIRDIDYKGNIPKDSFCEKF